MAMTPPSRTPEKSLLYYRIAPRYPTRLRRQQRRSTGHADEDASHRLPHRAPSEAKFAPLRSAAPLATPPVLAVELDRLRPLQSDALDHEVSSCTTAGRDCSARASPPDDSSHGNRPGCGNTTGTERTTSSIAGIESSRVVPHPRGRRRLSGHLRRKLRQH